MSHPGQPSEAGATLGHMRRPYPGAGTNASHRQQRTRDPQPWQDWGADRLTLWIQTLLLIRRPLNSAQRAQLGAIGALAVLRRSGGRAPGRSARARNRRKTI